MWHRCDDLALHAYHFLLPAPDAYVPGFFLGWPLLFSIPPRLSASSATPSSRSVLSTHCTTLCFTFTLITVCQLRVPMTSGTGPALTAQWWYSINSETLSTEWNGSLVIIITPVFPGDYRLRRFAATAASAWGSTSAQRANSWTMTWDADCSC